MVWDLVLLHSLTHRRYHTPLSEVQKTIVLDKINAAMLAPTAIGFRALQVSFDTVYRTVLETFTYMAQLLMAAAVVGLSVTLLNGQATGKTPTTTRYSVFTGAFGMIVAFLGLVCLFISAIPAIVPMVLDAVAGLLLLAGGIAWAVGLKGIKCEEEYYTKMYDNPLLNEGCVGGGGGARPYCGVAGDDPNKVTDEGTFRTLNVRCKYAMSDEIIQFILFLVSGILLFIGFLLMRKGKGGGRRTRYG